MFESSADPEAAPGQRAVATLRFSREPAYEKPAHLDVTLLAFKNRDSAHAAVRDLAITLGAHGQRQRGPALANDRRYYLFPVTEGFHRTEAVFRTGFLVTRLSLRASEGPFSAGDLGKIARPVLDRVEQLRFGKIAAPSLPGDFEKLDAAAAGRVRDRAAEGLAGAAAGALGTDGARAAGGGHATPDRGGGEPALLPPL